MWLGGSLGIWGRAQEALRIGCSWLSLVKGTDKSLESESAWHGMLGMREMEMPFSLPPCQQKRGWEVWTAAAAFPELHRINSGIGNRRLALCLSRLLLWVPLNSSRLISNPGNTSVMVITWAQHSPGDQAPGCLLHGCPQQKQSCYSWGRRGSQHQQTWAEWINDLWDQVERRIRSHYPGYNTSLNKHQ